MLDPTTLIESGGLVLITLIIFAESGMFVGFFLPGDTLLIAGGVLAANGNLALPIMIILACLAAIAGDNCGYWIGRKVGPRLFASSHKDRLIFRQEYVDKAHEFFQKYGSKSMLVAHFVPIVRTFIPAVAGVGSMNYGRFFIFDAIGDCAWAISVSLLGYYVGRRVPGLDRYILLAVLLVVVLSFLPVAYHLIKRNRRNRQARKN